MLSATSSELDRSSTRREEAATSRASRPPLGDLHEQPLLPHVLGQRHQRPELAVVADERAVGSQQVGTGQAGSDSLERIVDLSRESDAAPFALAVTSLRERRRRMVGWLTSDGLQSRAAEQPMHGPPDRIEHEPVGGRAAPRQR
jgi:hypothetical protein